MCEARKILIGERRLISGLVGLLLVIGVACDQERIAPVGPEQASEETAELRLRFVYNEAPLKAGKMAATQQDTGYWASNNPNDWRAWPDYVQQMIEVESGPEVNQTLEIEGDRARSTLRVKAGEKTLFVGCFEGGEVKYTGMGDVMAVPGEANEAAIVLFPWEGESFAVDEVRVLVFHVRDLPDFESPDAEIEVELAGGATMEFVWIEPGTFTMGSPESYTDARDEEKPQHEVTISQGFYLGKFEITQGQWEAVMGSMPWSGQSFVQSNPNHPAVYISWDDVQEFIQRLNEVAGEELYRLPTEAEWEYACRAGTTTRLSFGDDESQLGDYAWYRDNACGVGECYGHAVGTKWPNPWGLYDMLGNVFEWCQDWYADDYYSGSPSVDPLGPASGFYRVVRGITINATAQVARSAIRGRFDPPYIGFGIGARLLRTP